MATRQWLLFYQHFSTVSSTGRGLKVMYDRPLAPSATLPLLPLLSLTEHFPCRVLTINALAIRKPRRHQCMRRGLTKAQIENMILTFRGLIHHPFPPLSSELGMVSSHSSRCNGVKRNNKTHYTRTIRSGLFCLNFTNGTKWLVKLSFVSKCSRCNSVQVKRKILTLS